MKKQTRPQLLWVFQIYLDMLKIADPERRERLGNMFLQRQLSRATEKDFTQWRTTNRLSAATPVMRTRGSRLWLFRAWLDQYRIFETPVERERLTRLYLTRALSREIEREFHQFVRELANENEN